MTIPKDVQVSYLLWLTAVAAGFLELVHRVVGSASDLPATELLLQVLVRLSIFAFVIFLAARMRAGRQWARVSIAILVGGIGTESLVHEPISWLLAGNSLTDVQLTFASVSFGAIRAVHLVAVLAAMVFMFRPAANRYFRLSRGLRASAAR